MSPRASEFFSVRRHPCGDGRGVLFARLTHWGSDPRGGRMLARHGPWGARHALSLAVLGLASLLHSSAPALAQSGSPQPIGTRDFLFGSPRGWVAVRGSWLMPQAQGD